MKVRIVSCVLLIVLVFSGISLSAETNITPVQVLSDVEQLLYGQVQVGALLPRIEKIEDEIFGKVQTGPVLTRIERVDEFLTGNLKSRGVMLQLNLAEWGFYSSVRSGADPLLKRLERIEGEFYGEAQEGTLVERLKTMMMFIWGTSELDLKATAVAEQTLVEIQLLQTVDSAKNKEGDQVKYKVTSDVIVNDRVVIPKGSVGIGEITQVVSAGSLGKNGRVVIDFGTVPVLDGTGIRLGISEKALEENRRLELAAGASMAGIVLLGPIGLVSGYFVKGQDIQIVPETKFFVETERTREILGLNLAPGTRY